MVLAAGTFCTSKLAASTLGKHGLSQVCNFQYLDRFYTTTIEHGKMTSFFSIQTRFHD
ncbi:hypothetical protein BofuT4_uP156480.1 [Botrytis cinerea T4]|uniref:Uncharacterized protein n=1 Tax=Botryotinia fuckeliana (strain T4) TaxID=999810 RepID=G2YUF4_BOTF4|nr:hypothetical protein BofuT4_uP156480.1 [Botrytis cinerea T4]